MFANKPCSAQGTEEESPTSSTAVATAQKCSPAPSVQGLGGTILCPIQGDWLARAPTSAPGSGAGPWHPEEMSSSRHRWSLGSLLLLLGRNLAVLVKIHQDSINSTVGQSVLLPISYRFNSTPHFPVSIRWMFGNSLDVLITCTVLNCSLGAGGAPSSCIAKHFPHRTYQRRAEFFPDNGSLLLQHLQLNDSGVYSVRFRPPYQTWRVTLTVHQQRFTPEHPDTMEQDHIRYSVIGVCSSVSLLLLLLLFCCIWHRGAAQQQKRRIIKQQQVSSVEESHTESTLARDVATIYARIGDSFEQPQLRLTSEVMYTYIASPGPPGLDTGLTVGAASSGSFAEGPCG
ncbi:uncharacterized protein LOC141949416 isoform X2 [Strix uralensis]|uniref:uncharacterized protein LOC141949416 isoform X2 n=1 Tax=Strix uralensis TaxID=36305 RepID=UPI003DA66EC1